MVDIKINLHSALRGAIFRDCINGTIPSFFRFSNPVWVNKYFNKTKIF